MLQSDLCNYSDVCIVVKRSFTVANSKDANYNKKLVFKNNAPLIPFISKIINTLIDNAEDLDIVMIMYNLIQYRKNYSKTLGSLLNHYRD